MVNKYKTAVFSMYAAIEGAKIDKKLMRESIVNINGISKILSYGGGKCERKDSGFFCNYLLFIHNVRITNTYGSPVEKGTAEQSGCLRQ